MEKDISRKQVARAGGVLINDQASWPDILQAMEVLNYWRSKHVYPINTFQATLRNKLKKIDNTALVAQRLKRTPSIIGKLRRFPDMSLARMQDIAGLRAVVENVSKVYKLVHEYTDSIRLQHTLARQPYDYIKSPKASGYRGVHLIYKYKNKFCPEFDGLSVEIQIRTKLQHIWATAVETMGTFLDHSLKSSQGPGEWLDFFSLTGAAFARLEDCPSVPGYTRISDKQIYEMTCRESERLGVATRLKAFTIAADAIRDVGQQGYYHLVVLDLAGMEVRINSYGRRRLEEANEQYTGIEMQIANGAKLQAVLVSAGPISNLRRAYPNYFLDTRHFLRQLQRIEAKRNRLQTQVQLPLLPTS